MRYTIFVKPGSKKGPLIETGVGGELIVFVRERAVDGSANAAVAALLARHFGVSKSAVIVVRGHASRHKVVEVEA